MLGAEDQHEGGSRDIERFGSLVFAVRRGRHDAITPPFQVGDRLGRSAVAVQVDPFVRAPHDIDVGVELAAGFDRMYILHAEGFAVAHQRTGVLGMVGVLGEDRQ